MAPTSRLGAGALACALLVFATVGVSVAPAQTHRPPLPPPPLRQFVVCAIKIELLLGRGLDGTGDDADRAAASELVTALYQHERDRLTRQVQTELGPLAFAVYVPGSPSPGEAQLAELLAESCMHQALLRGHDSADVNVQARSRQIWDRFYAAVELPSTENETLRLELPPSDLIVAGEVFTGRVVDDRLEAGWSESGRAVEDGLVVEAAGQTARVGRGGLFVLHAPEQTGSYPVEVRHREKSSPLPIDGAFTVTALDGSGKARADDAPTASRVLLPGQPLVVLGGLRGGGSGLATRAFLGPSEVPLIAKTPNVAIFDVTRVPAGPHPLTLFEGGELIAVGAVDRITLEASSDRSTLDRGESAEFTVRVAGLPMSRSGSLGSPAPAAATSSSPIAFLDFVNNTPEVGRFRDRSDRFSLPIKSADLTAAAPPVHGWDQRTLIDRIETLVTGPGSRGEHGDVDARPDDAAVAGSQPRGAEAASTAAGGTFEHVQQYRATRVGDFHVRVEARLPEQSSGRAPMIVLQAPEPAGEAGGFQRPASPSTVAGDARLLTGVDERGAFADIDGQRFYFSIGFTQLGATDPPPAGRAQLFEASCSGSCQCQIESWDHADEVGAQVRAMDRSNPGWRSLTATARSCACEEARSQCYSLLSFECKARCKRYFGSALTERVSGFAVGAEMSECRDAGACEE